jgi:rubrerythrin
MLIKQLVANFQMRCIDMSKTDENLKAAFAGESQANRLYLGFSKKAEAETIHALNHVNITGQVKSTLENLGTAVSGETYEFKKMYPEFVTTAKQEAKKQALWSFDVANKVEQVHAKLFQKAIDAMKAKKDMDKVDYYVCGVCGNTVEGSPPEKCPICGAPKEQFFKPV